MKKIISFFVLLFVTTLFLPQLVFAQNPTPTPIVLPKGEVVNKDYFAASNSVTLAGTVNGDAFLAGGTVINEGTVNGDLLVAGGTVEIRGTVTGNVRVTGGQVVIAGNIGRNLSVAGGSVNVVNSARIGGSLAAAGGSVNVSAPIAKEANVAAGQTTISNSVGGDLSVAGPVSLTSTAAVAGNLNYWSNNPAQIQPGATIAGQTTQNIPSQAQPQPGKALGTFAAAKTTFSLAYLISYFIVGLLLLKFFPFSLQKISDNILTNPWGSLGVGFLVLILTPIIIFILFITLIGIPIALILLALFLITIFLTKIFVSYVLGQKILKYSNSKAGNIWALIIGLVIYFLLGLIPVIGGLTTFIFTLLGLGALFLQRKMFYQNTNK